MFSHLLRAALLACLFACPASADPAQVDLDETRLETGRRGVTLTLGLTQAVPYRLATLDNPPRLILDMADTDLAAFPRDALMQGVRRGVTDLRAGAGLPGWSRLVLELDGPYGVVRAGLLPGEGGAVITLRLASISQATFTARAGDADQVLWGLPPKSQLAGMSRQRQRGEGPLVVVLDPGHGGIDPGAERDGLREADLMLTFARELKGYLLRTGEFEVVLTREADVFVPLETRVSIARAAGADVFLSLHADALSDGGAAGATVYTLSEEASDAASAELAERHERADLLSGIDLAGHDDLVGAVLMSLARAETQPRSDRLADALVRGITATTGEMHKRPRLQAGFSVLRAPDIPSVLLEVGFMSSARDLANLRSPSWRSQMAGGIVAALQGWAVADAADAVLLRR